MVPLENVSHVIIPAEQKTTVIAFIKFEFNRIQSGKQKNPTDHLPSSMNRITTSEMDALVNYSDKAALLATSIVNTAQGF
ncbi:hypothetical protein CEXT_265981 [Caerostris extrusa]|uniref:Uncharacterized protein n=1 Tax=Caerostris extrusa TaxID=172846 RepID=A0AAV4TU04_CAEEX|nr:hypothetical protein CEXT_265981 [Caerostris extrusa]